MPSAAVRSKPTVMGVVKLFDDLSTSIDQRFVQQDNHNRDVIRRLDETEEDYAALSRRQELLNETQREKLVELEKVNIGTEGQINLLNEKLNTTNGKIDTVLEALKDMKLGWRVWVPFVFMGLLSLVGFGLQLMNYLKPHL